MFRFVCPVRSFLYHKLTNNNNNNKKKKKKKKNSRFCTQTKMQQAFVSFRLNSAVSYLS